MQAERLKRVKSAARRQPAGRRPRQSERAEQQGRRSGRGRWRPLGGDLARGRTQAEQGEGSGWPLRVCLVRHGRSSTRETGEIPGGFHPSAAMPGTGIRGEESTRPTSGGSRGWSRAAGRTEIFGYFAGGDGCQCPNCENAPCGGRSRVIDSRRESVSAAGAPRTATPDSPERDRWENDITKS